MTDGVTDPHHFDRNVVKLKIKPLVSNTHPNPVTSTPLGYNAQSAPKGEVETRVREIKDSKMTT